MKYDKEHIEIILQALSTGEGRVNACKRAGIDYQTFLDWLNDDRKLEFSEAVKKAEFSGNDKIKDICKRRIIEDKSWQSAAWWLERNFKSEFAIRQELTGKNGNDITHKIVVESEEQAKKIDDFFNE